MIYPSFFAKLARYKQGRFDISVKRYTHFNIGVCANYCPGPEEPTGNTTFQTCQKTTKNRKNAGKMAK